MIDLIDWNNCKEKFIKKVEKDPLRIRSIIEIANSRLEVVKQIKVNKKSSSIIVEQYYEIIKELLTALLLKNELKSKNHQCLISFFYENYKEYEIEANFISKMCYLRNRLDYYGEKIDFEFYEENKEKFEKIIKLLEKLCQP